jgi:outer membrane receptor protein involved in Fe transport
MRLPRRTGFVLAFLGAWIGVADAQEPTTIIGHVADAVTSEPLPGAQVFVPGTGIGTVVNQSGQYRLGPIPPGEVAVRAELLGYAPAERRVTVAAGQTVQNDFALAREYLRLDEIIVTGTAGWARGREVGHTVAQILPNRIAEPIATLDQLLAGRVPGVAVLPSSGAAGSGAQIRLRGNVSAVLSNQPLIYVDGIRVRSDGYPRNFPRAGEELRSAHDVASPLHDINPLDIDRVEILRGPAASTLYGTEAAAGVIQIFTKRGTAGPPVWKAQIEQGFDDLQSFGTPEKPYWGLDRWLRTAWRQRYALSVGGGDELRYHVSGLYDDNEGVLPNDWEERFVLRGNFEFRPTDALRLNWTTAYTNHDISNTPAGENRQGLTYNVFRTTQNALGDTTKGAIDRLLETEISTYIDHIVLGGTAHYTPTSRFTNRLTLGYDRAEAELRQLRPFGFILAPGGVLSNRRWISDILTVDYAGSVELPWISDLGSELAWGGQSVTTTTNSIGGYAESFPGPGEPTLSSGGLTLAFEDRARIVNAGGFLQALLGYKDRYFLTAGLRLDGNSAFGEDFGLQAYPRLGFSYVVSDEPAWSDAWGQLKLRAAYGHAGRAPGAFDASRTWRPSRLGDQPAFLPGQVGNPSLGPERTAETEVGLDGVFLDERLTVEATYYHRTTHDALFPVAQVPSLGFLGTQLQNVGKIRNQGIEIALAGVLLRGSAVSWEVGGYLATNHSKVLDLGGAPPLNLFEGVGWIQEGAPAPTLIGTLIKNPNEIAEPILERNHVFGANLPTRTIGVQTTLGLPAGIELSARGEYMGGHYIFDDAADGLAARGLWPECDGAYELAAEGRLDELTAWERVWCASPTDVPAEGPVYPADFFRLREITLRVPLLLAIPGASGTTITASARNIWTWKNEDFLGFDPEMAGPEGMNTAVRMTQSHVPVPATFTVSLRLAF